MKALRRFILTGLVVWLPILITFMVLSFIVNLLDGTLALLPEAYHPSHNIPGLGVLLSLTILIITGVIASNFLGQKLGHLGDRILTKIPLVRSIYNASKQLIQAVFSKNSVAFRKVMLIEYPRKGLWSLAFLTAKPPHEVFEQTKEEMMSLFVPTTPNPTSGFLVMVPKKDAIELSMPVDEALKLIISLGVAQASSQAASKITG